jgi:hypothetical protein
MLNQQTSLILSSRYGPFPFLCPKQNRRVVWVVPLKAMEDVSSMSQGARKISEGHRWLLSSAACARNELRLVVLRVKRWRPVSVNMEQGYSFFFLHHAVDRYLEL